LGGVARQPALIHGDLHRANVLCNAAGALALIDPHPFFADREVVRQVLGHASLATTSIYVDLSISCG
jgi:fructosamine-3-kinase